MASPTDHLPASDVKTDLPPAAQVFDTTPLANYNSSDLRTAFTAMTPTVSESTKNAIPDLLIDTGTANALLQIDDAKAGMAIPAGGGPFQALRPNFTEGQISDPDLAKASAFIRDNRMSGHVIKAGEVVPTGADFQTQDDALLNSAQLRESLHMPFNATSQQVDARMASDNDAALRQSLKLPADATEQQVDAVMSANNAAELRQSLGLAANASDKDVDAKMAANNAAALRTSLGLSSDASDADVDKASMAQLEKYIAGLQK